MLSWVGTKVERPAPIAAMRGAVGNLLWVYRLPGRSILIR
jgi:hypothetical protein